MKKEKNEQIYGYYLSLDIYDCEPRTVGSLKKSYYYLNNLPTLLRVDKASQPFVIYTDEKKYPDKAGISAWIPLIDSDKKTFSGISIHTLTPTNFISIDIYSTKEFEEEKIVAFTKRIFSPKKIEKKLLIKGEGYKQK